MQIERTTQSSAGIVDQDADRVVVTQARFDFDQIIPIGQIGGKDVDGDASILPELGSQCFHSFAVTGDQDQVVAAPSEAIGIGCADARRGAGDEDRWQLCHCRSLC
ncbi:hypothetical protein D9M69_659620 [compost metagenome]